MQVEVVALMTRPKRRRRLRRSTMTGMDKVRFGRALGKGARSAAKSLMEAADAAASPDPHPKPNAAPTRPTRTATLHDAVGSVVEAHHAVAHTKQQARKAGLAAVAPVVANAKRLSGVLWLELTGTFFTLFAPVSRRRGVEVAPRAGAWSQFAGSAQALFLRRRVRGVCVLCGEQLCAGEAARTALATET